MPKLMIKINQKYVVLLIVLMSASVIQAMEKFKDAVSKVGAVVAELKEGVNDSIESMRLARAKSRLFEAAKSGDILAFEEALKSGALIDSQDEIGRTPLHYVVLFNHYNLLDFILKYVQNRPGDDSGDKRSSKVVPFFEIHSKVPIMLWDGSVLINNGMAVLSNKGNLIYYVEYIDSSYFRGRYLNTDKECRERTENFGINEDVCQIIKHKRSPFVVLVLYTKFVLLRDSGRGWSTILQLEMDGNGDIVLSPTEEWGLYINGKKSEIF